MSFSSNQNVIHENELSSDHQKEKSKNLLKICSSSQFRKLTIAKHWLKTQAIEDNMMKPFFIIKMVNAYKVFCNKNNEEPLENEAFDELLRSMFTLVDEEEVSVEILRVKRIKCEEDNHKQDQSFYPVGNNRNDKQDERHQGMKLEQHKPNLLNKKIEHQRDDDQGLDLSYDETGSLHETKTHPETTGLTLGGLNTKCGSFGNNRGESSQFMQKYKTKMNLYESNDSNDSGIENSDGNGDPKFQHFHELTPVHDHFVSIVTPCNYPQRDNGETLKKYAITNSTKRNCNTEALLYTKEESNRCSHSGSVKRELENFNCPEEVSCDEQTRRELFHDKINKQEKIIQNVAKILSLNGFEQSSCFGDAKRLSQVFIIMLKKKQLHILLTVFAHSKTCRKEHRGLCQMFKRIICHLTISEHFCAVKEMYGHILRLHLDTCNGNICEFRKCKILQNMRRHGTSE